MKPMLTWGVGVLIAASLILSGLLAKDLLWVSDTITGQRQETILLRMGHDAPHDGFMQQAVDRFVQDIKQRSHGTVEIDLGKNETRAGRHNLILLAQQGKLDIVLLSVSELGDHLPSFRILDFPFYFSGPKAHHQFFDGPLGGRLLQQMNTLNLVGISFWEEGFRQLIANRKIERPRDLETMRFSVVPGFFSTKMFTEKSVLAVDGTVGSMGENIPPEKVDGWETLLTKSVVNRLKDHPYQVNLSYHGWQGMILAMSHEGYQRIPLEAQKIIEASAHELMQWTRHKSGQLEQKLEHVISEAGIPLQRIPRPLHTAEWNTKARQLSLGYEEILGAGLLAQIEEMELQRSRGKTKMDEWILGVDADFSSEHDHSGLAIKRGVRLAIDEINAGGGLRGKPITMVTTDNRGSVSLGTDNVKRLGQHWGAVAVIAGGTDPVVADQILMAKSQKMLMLIPHASSVGWMRIDGNAEDETRHVFRIAANEYQANRILFEELIKTQGKMALMLENTRNGRQARTIMAGYFADRRMEKPMIVWFNKGQTIFLDALRTMQEAGITDIFLESSPGETRQIRATMAAISFNPRIISRHGDADDQPATPGAGNYTFLQTYSFDIHSNRTAVGDTLRKRYWDLFDGPVPGHIPDASTTAQAYDLVFLLAQALQRSSTSGTVGLETTMERLETHHGAIKDYVLPFSHIRHEGLVPADLTMVQFNAEGMRMPVRNSRP
ncbi:MAG: TRAP transporter substrate-binding protein DctP [Magnetococcus sp. THC-1_WYH]